MSPPALKGFSVGICATGQARGVGDLLRWVFAEADEHAQDLRKVVVVASGCHAERVAELRLMAEMDSRLDLIVEEDRHGKADAINRILAEAEEETLVLVNADAHPRRGAIAELLEVMKGDSKIGVVSAKPEPQAGTGVAHRLAEMMWTTHNECSLALNHMNLSNHSSDELVAVRRSAIRQLPVGLVNDGAFLAGVARARGFSVRFCSSAGVEVENPARVSDAICQRRRILFGHAEVWRKTGSAPRTVESLLFLFPGIGLRLLVRTIARNPRFLLILPVAGVSEITASLLSVWDTLRSSKRHAIWKRYT